MRHETTQRRVPSSTSHSKTTDDNKGTISMLEEYCVEALYRMNKSWLRFVAMAEMVAEMETVGEAVREMVRRMVMVLRGEREGLESAKSNVGVS